MAINVRLSPKLEARAREHSDDIGLSLNALISVALDTYIRSSATASPRPVTRGETIEKAPPKGQNGPTPMVITGITDNQPFGSPPGPNASKKERQAYTAFQRSQRKLPL